MVLRMTEPVVSLPAAKAKNISLAGQYQSLAIWTCDNRSVLTYLFWEEAHPHTRALSEDQLLPK